MTENLKPSNDVPLEKSIPEAGASLESILCTEELQRRPSRPPDYEKENHALVKLVSALADSPGTIFQTLAETIQDITQCDSSGLSLLTRDGKTPHADGQRFYWPAICGMWNPHVGGGTPRNFGPCGDVLDQNRTLLFTHFERRYPYLMRVSPAAEECLLVPFYVNGKAVGTIWGIMHSDRRKFDAEDDRVMASLGKFASSAYQTLAHLEELKVEVAERERAEAEVRQLASGLEAKIRRLVEANVVGIVMWNLEGAITGANESFLHLVQHDRDDLASGRVRWADLTPPEWHDQDERALAELKASKIFQPFEKEFFRKDGSRVPVLLGGALFEGDGNEGVAFVLDLTEQKRQESGRLYSEQSYRVVVETASDAVVSIDDKGTIVFANPATATVFGYDPAELTGKPLTLLMPEYMRELHESGFKRYLTTGQRHMNWQGTELTALRKNGEEFPVEISFGELTRDGHKMFTGFLRDIGRRKSGEQALRRSEALLAEGQRLGQIGSFSWCVATEEIKWSEQLYRIYELETGVPVTLEVIRSRVHPEDLTLYEKMVEQARNERDDFEWQYRLLMPDHSIKFLHAVAHPIEDKNGQLEYIAAIQDVTERHLAEEVLIKTRSELARVARVMSLGTLTASIAHEVRQPLAAAVIDANTCSRWLNREEPDVAEARNATLRLIKNVTRASEIISRVSSLFTKSAPKRELVDVNEVAEEMMALLRGEAREHSISIHGNLAGDLPRIMADRVQLQQVLMNLMLNGIDAMKGVSTPGKLTIISRIDEKGQLLISVVDTGVGVLPEQTEQIFIPFFTSKTQGTGMGLTISRSIVESHGGRLWATPHSGPGATFEFSLPVEVTQQQAA